MSPFAIVMLAAAIVLVAAVHTRRLPAILSPDGRRSRRRLKRKSALRVVEPEPDDDFARSVERDLAALPTIDDHDR